MYSSNSSSSNYKPFSENDITSFTSEEDPNFFFPFSFPISPHIHFEYDAVNLHHHFFDPDFLTPATDMAAADPYPCPAAAELQPQEHPPPPPPVARRRNSKKDRHSKIDTARGPRDRRMRLSLEIARKFFDLQDLLGYDKASRTVDWLLRSSSAAINDLRSPNAIAGESCTSEDCGEAASSSAAKERRGRKGGKRGGGGGGVEQRRATVGRESRRKARDRARERTSQKRRLMRETESAHNNFPNHEFEDLSSASDEARMATAPACPFPSNSLHFHHATTTAAFLHQGEEIAEFEFNGKPWEAFNSFNLSG